MYLGPSLLIEVSKLYLVLFYLFRYEKIKSIKKLLILSVICFVGFEYLNRYFGGSDSYFTYMATISAIGIILYSLSDIKKIGDVFLVSIVISVIDIILAYFILMLLGIDMENVLERHYASLFLNLINVFVYIAIIFCKKSLGYYQKLFQLNLTRSEVLFLLVGMTSSGVCIGFIQMLDYKDNSGLSKRILLMATISIVVLVIGIIRFMMQQRYYKKLSVIERKFNEQQQYHHQQLIEMDEHLRKIRHDISDHISCIRQLSNQEMPTQLRKYIDDLQETYEEAKSYGSSTGNYVVDIITNDLHRKYEGKDIQLVWQGKFPIHIEMADMDICSLFANLLKNAYEATEKVQALSRKICVDIKVFNSNLIVCISNPMESPVQYHHNRFLTTKENKRMHGFGSLIIQDIVSKYHGEIHHTINHHVFKVEIMLVDIVKSY